MIFGEKVAVSGWTFGAKKKVSGGCNFENKVSIIGANDKNPLEDEPYFEGILDYGEFRTIFLKYNVCEIIIVQRKKLTEDESSELLRTTPPEN